MTNLYIGLDEFIFELHTKRTRIVYRHAAFWALLGPLIACGVFFDPPVLFFSLALFLFVCLLIASSQLIEFVSGLEPKMNLHCEIKRDEGNEAHVVFEASFGSVNFPLSNIDSVIVFDSDDWAWFAPSSLEPRVTLFVRTESGYLVRLPVPITVSGVGNLLSLLRPKTKWVTV